MPLNILADENIALVREGFGHLGTLQTVPGRQITAELLQDVDVLLVRSITRVDATLLAGSRCRFVGTATSGTDHVDLRWLQQQHIAFADAHGCNAEGVVDYVLAALALLGQRDRFDWTSLSIGIVGCGAVGSRLAQRAQALGMRVSIHDPFLDSTHSLAKYFAPLAVVLQQDIVSLHTPLTCSGPWPTFHLIDAAALERMHPEAILVNAARGAVLDTRALLAHMAAAPGLRVVLDAWEGEPEVDPVLLARVDVGTPHIAGYSRLGKLRGTLLLRDALHRHLGLNPPAPLYQPKEFSLALQTVPDESGVGLLQRCIVSAYELARDHAGMQGLLALEPARRAAEFDRQRRDYAERPEFGQFCIRAPGLPEAESRLLEAAGFRVVT